MLFSILVGSRFFPLGTEVVDNGLLDQNGNFLLDQNGNFLLGS